MQADTTLQTKPEEKASSLTAGIVKTLTSNIAIHVLGAITAVILARLLGAEGRGELNAITVWSSNFINIMSFSLALGNTYLLAKNAALKDQLYTNSILAGLFFGALGFLILWLAIPILLNSYRPEIVQATQMLSVIIISGIMIEYLLGLLQAKGFYGWIAIVRLFQFVTHLVGAIAFVFLNIKDAIAVGTLYLVVSCSCMLLAFAFCIIHLHPRLAISFTTFMAAFKYGLKAHLGTFANTLNSRLDLALVVVFLSAKEAGWYGVATTVTFVALSIATSFAYVLFPKASTLNHEEGRDTIIKSLIASLLVTTLFCVMVAIAVPIGLPLVFGSDFAGAVPAVEILLIGTIAQGGAVVIIGGMRGLGYPGVGTISELISLIVMAAGLLVLLPPFDYIGAACASSLGYIANLVVCWLLLERHYPRSYKLLAPTLASQLREIKYFTKRFTAKKLTNGKTKL